MRQVHRGTVSPRLSAATAQGAILLAALSTACDPEPAPKQQTACTLEAAPAAPVISGDANGDGHFDVADGLYYQRHWLAGGPPAACASAVDMVPDQVIELSDATAIWIHLGPHRVTQVPDHETRTPDASGCDQAEALAQAEDARLQAPPACGDGLALAIDAPAQATGAANADLEFSAAVTLTSPNLPAEAWSFTVSAEGCAVSAATTLGTAAADREDSPPGLRNGGMAWQALRDGGLEAITGLDWRDPLALPAQAAPQKIHALTLRATAPASGCTPCALSLSAPGAPLESVVSAGGWRYEPALSGATVQVCAE